MDVNWKIEEALITVRDGIQLTPEQAARMQMAQAPRENTRDLRRTAAAALVAVARKLDPEAAAAWPSEAVQGRPA